MAGARIATWRSPKIRASEALFQRNKAPILSYATFTSPLPAYFFIVPRRFSLEKHPV